MALVTTVLAGAAAAQTGPARTPPDRQLVLDAMKRATSFMVETVSTRGGYVWSYLPDFSRRWGELEARDTMIWVQPPGTPVMGHLFLDAYHATGDEYYYRAAEQAAGALIWGQLPSGGWNYVIDFAGDRSLRDWYATVGRNAWRLEEFQHYWGNGTFDDGGTVESAKLLLRLYMEKRDPKYRPALDKAIGYVLDSQYPIGGWPQRYPLQREFSHHGKPDYTSFITFNDEVAGGNIDFLLMCYQALGDARLRDPIIRGMHAYLVTQQGPPQAAWALQYTPELEPAGARTYEPTALVTHATAENVAQLLKFYRLTGDPKFLARVPEALDWLDAVRLPASLAETSRGATHPTFVEIGTNKPLFVHRRGSNVVNGAYYVDGDPQNTIGHYSSFRTIDVAQLRQLHAEAKALSPATLRARSPLAPGAGAVDLPRHFVAVEPRDVGPGRPGAPGASAGSPADRAARAIASLDDRGRWMTALYSTSHPYRGDGPAVAAPGDFSRTQVGDDTDTSPYRAERLLGISTGVYIRNMSDLIRALDRQ